MLNRIVLAGRLTKDVELRKLANGMAVASFNLASDELSKNADGSKKVIFIGVSLFGKSAENVAKYVQKGSLVAVDGRITQRKYTNKQNQQVTSTEIVADNVQFLEPKPQAAEPANKPIQVEDDLPNAQ